MEYYCRILQLICFVAFSASVSVKDKYEMITYGIGIILFVVWELFDLIKMRKKITNVTYNTEYIKEE